MAVLVTDGITAEEERRAHEQTKSAAREARALADERETRIAAQDEKVHNLRRQIEGLRIEAATLTERAAHVAELRTVLKTFQQQQGRAEDAAKTKASPKRRTKPEGEVR